MRIQETKIYKFEELSEEAKKKAIEKWRNKYADDFAWRDETMDSLKAIFKESGIKLTDYSIGLWHHSWLKHDLDRDVADLTGARALAWIENNLLYKLRISRSQYLKNRKDYFKYGKAYRIGFIKPCPFTGYCSDEDFLESLLNDAKNGIELGQCYKNLADKCAEIFQSEYDDQNSDESISESLMINEYEFTEEGDHI